MSEVFEGYERQYCELSANLSKKCTAAGALDGERKKQKLSEIRTGLEDAESLIRKMDLEARSLQPNVKAVLLAKLREYKSDLNNLKSEVKRIASGNLNPAARDELLESGMADALSASADQRSRLMMTTERLNQSSDRIKDSRRTMLETEELGVSILQDLHSQRQALLHANNTMKWPILQAFPAFSPRYLRPFLRLCAQQSAHAIGKKLHALILTTGLYTTQHSFLLNTLLHFYASCGNTPSARKLFDEIPLSSKDTADWTALMSSFSRQNMPREALCLFAQMHQNIVEIDDVAMICLFSACAWLRDLEVGSQGHGFVVKTGLKGRTKVSNGVMDMYGKCGLVGEMKRVFSEMKEKNVVSWTVFLDGVLKWEGVKSGRLVFDDMPERNEVAWTIMIVSYVGSGFCKEGFSLLSEMMFHWQFKLNYITLCSLLSACAQSGDVMMGRWVHVYGLKVMGMEMDIMVGTALVDMYAKCGRIDTAVKVFDCMPRRNVVAWNAMLSGLAMHGRGRVVVDMFPRMIEEVRPDDLTFIAILSACSHSGLIDEGSYYFESLESVYGIPPKIDHYACMVDLLGRAGRLEEAETLIKQMPIAPNEVVLGSLLGSCSAHGKLQLGERVLQRLIEMDPLNTEYHILLSNMYALAGKRNKANALRKVLKVKGIRKVPGMSSIYVDGQLHQFSAGDKSHPRTREIYPTLYDMIQRLRSAGYVPNTASQVLSGTDGVGDNVGELLEEKEQALFLHSEKLAVCFGLLSTKPGTRLYIFKNLRICQDCHAAFKIVSKIYNREIVVRDRNRFHCFKQGSCSCSDFW
ncbi:hypothetical protein CCACVL1_13723 [Corchorus capsularis]|uniref:DYW domain-containing protein n=1 Tax=Corchorus capsularis TaxID=210143 RepID=A0A1R3IA34_COCAP|nr:hypothetical protein CCACVL1_13723 [Corchorus capsularis]